MIRRAQPQDIPGIRQLWETCFPDEGGFNDYFFAHFFDCGTVLLSEEQGTLCAMVQMLPYRLLTGGREQEITYIYGACTDPAHRRKGHMARSRHPLRSTGSRAERLRRSSQPSLGCLIFTVRLAMSRFSMWKSVKSCEQWMAKRRGG